MKRTLSFFFLLLVCFSTLCSCGFRGPRQEVESITRIMIPESLFTFANADQDDSLKSLEPYCTDAWLEEEDLWLEITEEERQALSDIYQENRDTIIAKLEAENPLYSCTVSEDYKDQAGKTTVLTVG